MGGVLRTLEWALSEDCGLLRSPERAMVWKWSSVEVGSYGSAVVGKKAAAYATVCCVNGCTYVAAGSFREDAYDVA